MSTAPVWDNPSLPKPPASFSVLLLKGRERAFAHMRLYTYVRLNTLSHGTYFPFVLQCQDAKETPELHFEKLTETVAMMYGEIFTRLTNAMDIRPQVSTESMYRSM